MSLQRRSHRRNFSDFSLTFLAYLLLLESFDSVKMSFESFSITYHVLLALFCWPWNCSLPQLVASISQPLKSREKQVSVLRKFRIVGSRVVYDDK